MTGVRHCAQVGKIFFFLILLFICAYKAWVISAPCPHPLPGKIFLNKTQKALSMAGHCDTCLSSQLCQEAQWEDYSPGWPGNKMRPYLKNNQSEKKEKGLAEWLKW
jgi:hypothetical protein